MSAVEIHWNAEGLQRLRAAIEQGAIDVMHDVQADAVQLSPKDTGHNARSIDIAVEPTSSGVQVEVFSQSGYGGFLEIGTAKMPARPYLKPAFDLHRHEFTSAIRKRIRGG